jgi:copper chaperone NosL
MRFHNGGLMFFMCLAVGCARGVAPAELAAVNTQCRFCRMAVSDVHFAAQIAAPGAEPVFFDDIGCLRDYLGSASADVPAGAVAFVADHRTGVWVRAADAIYTRPPTLGTPMGGGVIAHGAGASRDQDAAAKGGAPVDLAAIFGPAGPPKGDAR